MKTYTMRYGHIIDINNEELIDEAIKNREILNITKEINKFDI